MPGDKLYKYYFVGVAEPVEIQAENRKQARAMLISVMPKLHEKYRKSRKVEGETVTKLLIGVSSRVDDKGVKYIWVGLHMCRSGWQSEKEIEDIADKIEKEESIINI